VYLKRVLEEIAGSLGGDSRPLSTSLADLERLYEQRHELYERLADVTEVSDNIDSVVAQVRLHINARILVINGPNLNMLGVREPGIYGGSTLRDLTELLRAHAEEKGVFLAHFQSNHEGALIDEIQEAHGKYDGIVINPGAYTHYSYAIYDALKAIDVPAVEVHISDITSREEFRKISVTAPACVAQVFGEGFPGYVRAMDILLERIGNE
jgi:3-dehydroquinate dehydratase-2